MTIMFWWQERCLTRSLRSLGRYCSCHSNIKLISSCHSVTSCIYLNTSGCNDQILVSSNLFMWVWDKKVTRSSKCIRDQTNRKMIRVQIILTRIDLHTPDTDWQAGEDTKSRGRFGKPRTLIKGSSPPRRTNSLQWSSVELLLRIESTNRTYGEILSINKLVLHSMFCFFELVSTLRFIEWYICPKNSYQNCTIHICQIRLWWEKQAFIIETYM